MNRTDRTRGRAVLQGAVLGCCLLAALGWGQPAAVGKDQDERVKKAISRGLDWLAKNQNRDGSWVASNGQYPTAMTGMAGMALIAEGSTTTQGKYSANIRRAVDFLVARSNPETGLIGDGPSDNRYTYGHGFAMLFLSQALGEEEDRDRRRTLVKVLTKAVEFTGNAQTSSGGWGYVSARDGNDFDEGSTTITQVQGLRACRNAGIPVPTQIIEKAIKYIRNCTNSDGGVQYSSKSGGGSRPPITAAAIACLFNAGQYDSKYVPKLLNYCRRNPQLNNPSNGGGGHWHYAHYYYSQVMYRQAGDEWDTYRKQMFAKLVNEQAQNGSWSQGYVGGVYTTSINLTILQLENAYLPIYQR